MLTPGVKTVAQTPVLIKAKRVQLQTLLSLHDDFDKDVASFADIIFRLVALDPAFAERNVVLQVREYTAFNLLNLKLTFVLVISEVGES